MESITVKMDCARTKSCRIAFPTGDFGDGKGKEPRVSQSSALTAAPVRKASVHDRKVYRDESELDAYFRALIAIVRVELRDPSFSAHLRNLASGAGERGSAAHRLS